MGMGDYRVDIEGWARGSREGVSKVGEFCPGWIDVGVSFVAMDIGGGQSSTPI